MRIEIDPPSGVAPLLVGMSVEGARTAMGHWGIPEFISGVATPQLRVMDAQLSVDIFAHFEDGESVSAIEVWRPRDPSIVEVIWENINIFDTAADQILAHARERGIDVNDSDPLNPNLPGLTLGFNRYNRSPRNLPALPPFFESVLVAAPGYYSVEVDVDDLLRNLGM